MTAPLAPLASMMTSAGIVTPTISADPATTKAKRAPRTWLEYEHPEFETSAGRWRFSWDFYTGSVIFEDRVSAYLVQRARGESDDAFRERCRMAEYTNHFAAVVDSLTGMMAAVEKNAERVWGPEAGGGLGDPSDPKSQASRLIRDASGDGEGWFTLWKRVTAMLFVLRRAWLLVDAATPGSPIVRVVFPTDLPNWRFDDITGALVEAVVTELADDRTTLRDKPKLVERKLYLTADGWTRYTLDEDGQESEVPGSAGTWTYFTRAGVKTIPLVLAELPIARDVGFSLAKKAQGMFNKESERDHLLRYGNFQYLGLDVPDDATYTAVVGHIKRGVNVLQGTGHRYIAPDTAPATLSTEVLKRKVEEFYIVGFREYGDAGRERTATEVRQDVAAGLGAVLSLAKDALDNAENDVLYFVEQALAPNVASRWGLARVKRSDNFVPMDAEDVAKKLADRFLGSDKPATVGVAGRAEVARRAAKAAGIEADDSQLLAHSRVSVITDALAAMPSLTLPAKVKAAVAVDLAIAAGYVDGGDAKAVDALIADAQTAAEAAAEAARRMAEGFPGGDPGDDEEDEDEPPAGDAQGGPGEDDEDEGEDA